MNGELEKKLLGRPVYGLVTDMNLATRIAKTAESLHLGVRNFDKVEPLIQWAKREIPCLVILDWESKEADAYKALKELRELTDLRKTTVIGFVTAAKRQVGEEAQRAGCLKVYLKTDFLKNLDDLVM